ncbi:hypothetical protein [Sulfurovum sp. TSL1]|uniref:hypothetical protein n=1 Tax=Sulfurovum sp. TSL1 TaxID=2826994 RepID=UPI001CC428BD|nr:hypothetical protein [Sulfurovum sp. TSL1]GIT98004.1 hypothetical protein TSL1_08250 [Sulfurovum sp. TSL1]
MKRHLLLPVLVAFGFSGCTSSIGHLIEPKKPTETTQPSQQIQTSQTQYGYEEPTPEKKEAYENIMRKVASGIQDDPNYQRLTLNTPEKKEWFKKLTYRLWDRQITRHQFINEGLKRYPDHGYELNFIVRGFTFN